MKKILFLISFIILFAIIERKDCFAVPSPATITTDSISIYPNPNNGIFTITTIVGEVGEIIAISIYNSFGKRIYESKELTTEKTTEKFINLQPILPGIYCVHFVHKKDTVIKKIIIN